MKLMSATTDTAQYDVYLTDTAPGVSVVRDDGMVSVTRWQTIKEAVAFLIGCGCDLSNADNGKELIEKAITVKYAAM